MTTRKPTTRRQVLASMAALSAAPIAGAQAAYPSRPIRVVIPWPPGQATDLVGRVVAQKLSETLGQPAVPDNKAGAGGMIGTDFVAKAPPDGYTLLMGSSGPVTLNPLVQKTPYDVDRDLIPVAMVGHSGYILVTSPSFPANNAREFVALMKANPGKYTFASSGTGATAHIVAEWFNSRAGITATHVPYKGSAAALTDVASGQVAYATETVAASMPLIRAGKLKPFGLTTAKASSLAPGIEPLASSLNLPGYDAAAWLGVMVATGTPRPIIDKLSSTIANFMQVAEVREKLNSVGLEVNYLAADDFARHLKETSARFGEVIKRQGIKVD